MGKVLDDVARFARSAWRIIVLFVALRLIAGIAIIAFGGGIAWGVEITLVCAAAVAVYVLVALAVRRWSPPRRA
jgi:hypothetical protein